MTCSFPTSARTVLLPHQSSRTSLTLPLRITPRQSVRSPRRNRNSSFAYLRVNAPRHFSMVSISSSSIPSKSPVFLSMSVLPLIVSVVKTTFQLY